MPERQSLRCRHIRIVHDRAVSHLCSGCGHGFSTGRTARVHQTGITVPPECRTGRIIPAPSNQIKANWICSGCEVSFHSQSKYKQHQSESASEACNTGRFYHIPSLKERYTISPSVRRKMRDSPTCSLCSAVFASKGGLTQHVRRIHVKERTICLGCKQVFAAQQSVQAHQKKAPACTGKRWFHVPPPGEGDQILCLSCGEICDGMTSFESHKPVSQKCQEAESYFIPAISNMGPR
ncbi:hypothetical protein BT69DRAFT_158306 [Atractiella rhizophila]|nr:hypothetical protein BT69DRAFT_158306 [Atractiella rhizophila]